MNYGFALFLLPVIEYVLLCCIYIYIYIFIYSYVSYFGWLIFQLVGLIIPTGTTNVGSQLLQHLMTLLVSATL